MRELSIEEKAQRYDEALERAMELSTDLPNGRNDRLYHVWDLESIFPELKEDEDEKIRKEIVNFINHKKAMGSVTPEESKRTGSWIAWLEKQGEHANFCSKIQIGDKVTRNEDGVLVNLSQLKRVAKKDEKQGEQKPDYCHHEVDLSGCSEEYCKAYYDGWNNCNMQHSQCKSELDDVVKCLINGMKFYYEDNKDATWGTNKWSMPIKHIIEVLEKRVELTDKVVPKFHEGDWVIDKQGIVHQIANVIENVTYHTYGYDIVGGGYFNDNAEGVRLWTIQDAKDGDILAIEPIQKERSNSFVAIFKERGLDFFNSYCFVSFDGEFIQGTTGHSINVHPATKEQRSQLEKAMADAGYTFDFEKKELKKIKQKTAWSEEVQEWSEEDEETLKDIITSMTNLKDSATSDALRWIYDSKINWLESLKGRYTWKPSDEQMGVIEAVINNRSFQRRHLDSLYADLKKLRKE